MEEAPPALMSQLAVELVEMRALLLVSLDPGFNTTMVFLWLWPHNHNQTTTMDLTTMDCFGLRSRIHGCVWL